MKLAGIARLARLELTDEESVRMGQQLEAILSYVATLEELDTNAVEPTSHPLPGSTPQRVDQVGDHLPLEKSLSNAPMCDEDSFIVPKVV
mgnify:FL=1